jgi:adenine-specific DNA-methyltransferase
LASVKGCRSKIMSNNSTNGKKVEDYSKEELIELVKDLKKRKKFGLVWEAKPEDVVEQCKRELPVLKEVESLAIENAPGEPTNLIIEGDNYHALSVLNYTHAGKIDVIYIDPPYNTGAQDWKYNNKYVDDTDAFRHSKWISLMSKRLELAKNLLRSTGIIVVTIDDYEIASLKLLMNDIFGLENYLGTVAIRNNPSGRSTLRGFSVNHEYALFYSRTSDAKIGRLPHSDEQVSRYKERDKNGYFEWENFRKNGTDSDRADRPKQFYPLVINKSTLKLRVPKINWSAAARKYEFKDKLGKNEEIVLPINDGNEKVWKFGLERISSVVAELLVKRKNGIFELYRKKYLSEVGSLPRTWWDKPGYSARDNGTRTLTEILGVNNKFDFPKAPEAVVDCIRVANSPSNGILLDFFAGSGTTGHAVLKLNQEDGGNRQFILCTNNENKIAENVTYPRIKKVITGYGDGKNKENGIPANVRYFKTDFVAKDEVSDNTRRALVARSTEMICVREDTFGKKYDNKQFKIYTNGKIATGILFDLDAIEDFKVKLSTLKMPAHLYVFSLSNDVFADDFSDLPVKHKLCPIPESILEVYRKIFA